MMTCRTDYLDIRPYADSYERDCSGVYQLARLRIGPMVLEIVIVGRTPYHTG